MTSPSSAQIKTWESFKAVARRLDLEIKRTNLNFAQLAIIYDFQRSKGIASNIDPRQIEADTSAITARNQRFQKLLGEVELGRHGFGLRFVAGDFDIMAPASTTADVLAQYQLSGWPLLLVGVVLVSGAIAYMAAIRQQNEELNGKLSALKDDADSMLCADPTSTDCREWTEAKERSGYDRRENVIDTVTDEIESFPDTVKKIGAGIGIGVLIAAAAVWWFTWDRKRR